MEKIYKLINGDRIEYSEEEYAIAQNQIDIHREITQKDIVNEVQQRLDVFARTRNYDNILSACTYATSTVPKFAEEGQYAVNARDSTWAALYQLMEDVINGIQNAPTSYSDVVPFLPELIWP